MKVLSLFDGCACAMQALKNINVKVDKYYASEIDEYAIKVAMANHPEIIQVGNVELIKGKQYKNIDLLVGGSPCQGFSMVGKQLNFKDPRSKLFFEYVRVLKESKPKHFLLENVVMKQEYQDVISKHLGVQPIEINSNLVTAQNRRRLYWANFPIKHPKDLGITFGSVRLKGVPVKGGKYFNKTNYELIERAEKKGNHKLKIFKDTDKFCTIVASSCKGLGTFRLWGVQDTHGVRYPHPVEFERLQGLPDNYTQLVSNTQRYKMLGNSFTVPVIEHILKEIV